jgi:hypothetical protein
MNKYPNKNKSLYKSKEENGGNLPKKAKNSLKNVKFA